jgi:hypothetical protein
MARTKPADTAPESETTEQAAPASGRGSLLGKITVAAIDAQPKAKSLKEGEAYSVAVIMGEAASHSVAQSNYGEFTKFKGNFAAVNMRTGERFRSANLILPQIVEHVLSSAIDEAEGSVQFALEIGVKYSEKGNTGYVYTIKPLLEPSDSDPLKQLEDKVSTLVKLPQLALSGPKA